MNSATAIPAPAAGPNGHAYWLKAWLATQPVLLLVVSAIALRLIVFTSRGDYIAYDEGWYLLLGRSLFNGEGYTLTGLRHTTLSPLFPVLAGAVGAVLGNIVWGGRIVAALAAGLLVWPCWHLFRRVAGPRVALVACIFIVVTPSLTPFAAPYWIEWDLWVGAEPVLHLFLFTGLALTLRARDNGSAVASALAGAAFALAYLARPEAIIVFGIVGLSVGISALARRSLGRTLRAILMAVAFVATATPYWVYLHDTLDRWALSGRVVQLPVRRQAPESPGTGSAARTAQRGGTASSIERMLWQDDNTPYVRVLYGLDASGTRLRSTYWGVPMTDAGLDSLASRRNPSAALRSVAPISAVRQAGGTAPVDTAGPALNGLTPAAGPASSDGVRQPGRLELYTRALGVAVPWFIWPLAIIGLFGRRPSPAEELLAAAPLILTSIIIARVIGADPRTQLFIVPLVLLYAARGVWLIDMVAERYAGRAADLRRGFIGAVATAIVGLALVSTIVHWVWMGLAMGSPHHTIGAANYRIGIELQRIVPEGEPVMSWHPAVALYAERDWRVLPYVSLKNIVRFANAIDCDHIVLSRYYPGSKLFEQIDRDHLVLHVPVDVPLDAEGWRIEIRGGDDSHVTGELRYSAPGAGRE